MRSAALREPSTLSIHHKVASLEAQLMVLLHQGRQGVKNSGLLQIPRDELEAVLGNLRRLRTSMSSHQPRLRALNGSKIFIREKVLL